MEDLAHSSKPTEAFTQAVIIQWVERQEEKNDVVAVYRDAVELAVAALCEKGADVIADLLRASVVPETVSACGGRRAG